MIEWRGLQKTVILWIRNSNWLVYIFVEFSIIFIFNSIKLWILKIWIINWILLSSLGLFNYFLLCFGDIWSVIKWWSWENGPPVVDLLMWLVWSYKWAQKMISKKSSKIANQNKSKKKSSRWSLMRRYFVNIEQQRVLP